MTLSCSLNAKNECKYWGVGAFSKTASENMRIWKEVNCKIILRDSHFVQRLYGCVL